jgi:aldehyde dehydrogenase (NAD+)
MHEQEQAMISEGAPDFDLLPTPADLLAAQRTYFGKHITKDYDFRRRQLLQLKSAVRRYESEILSALHADLRKSNQEAWLTEIAMVNSEIDLHLSRLKSWMRARRVPAPAHVWPSKGHLHYEPLGCALIIAPWNYPFQLLITPLIGAISAGCTAILKPSEFTPTVARVMARLIRETFDPAYIALVEGDHTVGASLLTQRYDIIFFTGSPAVGKIVMTAAAEHLTPVILELGGKSPCIVDASADVKMAARRIAWGKGVNAGQTCIAPDYVYAHASVKVRLMEALRDAFADLYGPDARSSDVYPRIVSDRAFRRLEGLLKGHTPHSGGQTDASDRFIAPTLLDDVSVSDPIMQQEIFGPILPVLAFQELPDVITHVNAGPKPLALYYFGEESAADDLIRQTSSGGVCINDTLMHFAHHNLPFGGVGNSGMGKYHGRESFLAFSNTRAVVKSPTWPDLPFRYPPFRYFRFLRKFF